MPYQCIKCFVSYVFCSHETEAELIEATAREALNTSQEALRIAESAIQKPSNVAYDIELIKRKYVITLQYILFNIQLK